MNSISISGRLTNDPELKTTQTGISVCSFRLAVKRPNVKDKTDFINCVAWRSNAEYLTRNGHKGEQVLVYGMLTSRDWEDKNENNRTSYEVVADTVAVVDRKHETKEQQPFTPPNNVDFEEINDGPLPF